ncbi:MAG: hypothetical protein ACLPWO_07345 [Thermoplasmata archaeon]
MWRRRPTAVVCAVLVVILLLVLGLPSPWGLGAFERNQPPVWIVSFRLNQSALTPDGPGVILTVENTGGSSIVHLSASVELRALHEFVFPGVNVTTPLAPREFASANEFILGPSPGLACSAFYNWTISGTYSSGSGFEVHASAVFYCPPVDFGQQPAP